GGGTIVGGHGSNPISNLTGVNVSATEGLAFTNVAVLTFNDSGNPPAGNYSASIDWGDNTSPSAGTGSINGSMVTIRGGHTYGDEGTYTITVTLKQGSALTTTFKTTATVVDAAPIVNAFNGATINEGTAYSASGTFTDPSNDTWTATVNYGDGTGTQM